MGGKPRAEGRARRKKQASKEASKRPHAASRMPSRALSAHKMDVEGLEAAVASMWRRCGGQSALLTGGPRGVAALASRGATNCYRRAHYAMWMQHAGTRGGNFTEPKRGEPHRSWPSCAPGTHRHQTTQPRRSSLTRPPSVEIAIMTECRGWCRGFRGTKPSVEPNDATAMGNQTRADRKSTRLNSSHSGESRMPSSA